MKNTFMKDFLSSWVVTLVALPLCLGVALASGVSPMAGLLSGIIGGLIVGILSGAPLQVSGPAAGLVVMVFEIVETHGVGGLGVICLMAGVFQILAAYLKLGPYFRATSPALIKGMLTGIGVIIFLGQLQIMFGFTPHSKGYLNALYFPQNLLSLFQSSLSLDNLGAEQLAGPIGLMGLLLMIVWQKWDLKLTKMIPASLVAVVVMTSLVALGGWDVRFIKIPSDPLNGINFLSIDFLRSEWKSSWIFSAAALAFIASIETLLCVSALDELHSGPKSKYNRELMAQGVGNLCAGLVGAIPLTGVIVRSSANISSGAQTRLSTILHGLWILIAVLLLPHLLNRIPISVLASILVLTGWKLMDFKCLKTLKKYGQGEVLIYLSTVGGIVLFDLLTGVMLGFVFSLIKLIMQLLQLEVSQSVEENKTLQISLKGRASFLNLPKLIKELDAVPAGPAPIVVDLNEVDYMDHAGLAHLQSWKRQLESKNYQVKVFGGAYSPLFD